ncbi:MAG: hypothetical protein HQK53_20305, partial [Oligoflexia bacterium]|nr:hypothetical protein [Oligoflexia bacterium]
MDSWLKPSSRLFLSLLVIILLAFSMNIFAGAGASRSLEPAIEFNGIITEGTLPPRPDCTAIAGPLITDDEKKICDAADKVLKKLTVTKKTIRKDDPKSGLAGVIVPELFQGGINPIKHSAIIAKNEEEDNTRPLDTVWGGWHDSVLDSIKVYQALPNRPRTLSGWYIQGGDLEEVTGFSIDGLGSPGFTAKTFTDTLLENSQKVNVKGMDYTLFSKLFKPGPITSEAQKTEFVRRVMKYRLPGDRDKPYRMFCSYFVNQMIQNTLVDSILDEAYAPGKSALRQLEEKIKDLATNEEKLKKAPRPKNNQDVKNIEGLQTAIGAL